MADQGYDGQNEATDATDDYNTVDFQIAQALRAVSTATLVKVMAVSNSGTVDKIGTVDVLPLVNLIDGAGKTTKHVNIQKIPYMRTVGGSKGIIMDPKVGDIGVAVFADRDIQAVRKAKNQAPPGSRRRFSMADGMYLTSVIADKPTSYLQFDNDGNITLSPDSGVTWIKVEPDKITLHTSGLCAYVRPTRIDLGKLNAPHAVMTVDGPSSKVYAVIDENGP